MNLWRLCLCLPIPAPKQLPSSPTTFWIPQAFPAFIFLDAR